MLFYRTISMTNKSVNTFICVTETFLNFNVIMYLRNPLIVTSQIVILISCLTHNT